MSREREIRIVGYREASGTLLEDERLLASARHESRQAASDEIVAGRIIYEAKRRFLQHITEYVLESRGTVAEYEMNVKTLVGIASPDVASREADGKFHLSRTSGRTRLSRVEEKVPPTGRFVALSRYIDARFALDFPAAIAAWHTDEPIAVHIGDQHRSARERMVVESVSEYLRSEFGRDVDKNT